MTKKNIFIFLPILLFWTWIYWIRDYCIFYIGSELPNSARVLSAVLIFGAILFFLSVIAILFCLVQLLLLCHHKQSNKYILIRNVALLVLYVLVFQIKPKPDFVPFASGLKSYYAKEVNLLRFQQWIESGQTKEIEIQLSEPYDEYDFPAPLLDDMRKVSAVKIDIKKTPSGSLYLRLWSYTLWMGDYGFVVGANKDILPLNEYGPLEYRTEIGNKSFVWIRER